MENHGLTDVTFEVRHSLVQLSLGHGVPLSLGQYSEWKHLQMLRVSKYLSSLVHGNLLEVEQEGTCIGSSSPLAGLRQLVTGGTPTDSLYSSLQYYLSITHLHIVPGPNI